MRLIKYRKHTTPVSRYQEKIAEIQLDCHPHMAMARAIQLQNRETDKNIIWVVVR